MKISNLNPNKYERRIKDPSVMIGWWSSSSKQGEQNRHPANPNQLKKKKKEKHILQMMFSFIWFYFCM